ncbi:calcium-binding protein [Streptomyces sp. NPDC051041]|uniref:calcium-binding protein n=1 Tax=Streptomyces sp. NPDC051041 TaxID=3365640 RepID=UPI00378A0883
MFSHHASRRGSRTAAALTLALGAGLAVPLVLAGQAGAGTPSATAALRPYDQAIVYTAAPGQANKVTVDASASEGRTEITYVIDDEVPIDAGDGCAHPDDADRTKVSCTIATPESQDPYPTLDVILGDGDDTLAYRNATGQTYYHARIELGDGNDTATHAGSTDGNTVSGGAGDDDLTVGSAGVVYGDEGVDMIHAADGTIAQGGDGDDVIFSDGEGGSVDGGADDDVIHGGAGDQDLSGGDGSDTIYGEADDDRLYGGRGNDFLYGGTGNDVLYGNSGNDTIYGNSGNDELYGGPGTDTLSGGPGTNVVRQD